MKSFLVGFPALVMGSVPCCQAILVEYPNEDAIFGSQEELSPSQVAGSLVKCRTFSAGTGCQGENVH
jgi:hypothetical protein